MKKYHYIQHDGKQGYILADELKFENSETTGLDNTRSPVQSWIFYRGGVKYREMPEWMIHGEPELIPRKVNK